MRFLAQRVASTPCPGYEGGANRLHHLRPPAARLGCQEGLGPPEVFGGGRRRLGEQDARVAREGDEVEGILGVEALERQFHGLFGLFNREAGHRPRRIQHEDQLLGRDLLWGDAIGRLQEQQEETFLAVVVGEHGVLDLAACDAVPEDEILVGDHGLILEAHDGLARSESLHADLMARRAQAFDREAGV